MKAIILSAGKGTRLGDLTKKTAKPMLLLVGKPILEYVIAYLRSNNITDIGINLLTGSKQIINHFGDGSGFGVDIYYSYEKKLLGTAGSLLPFEEWLGEDKEFVVIYGDILTNQPLEALVELHREKGSFATLLLHRRKESNSYIELDDNFRIICFKERPNQIEMQNIKELNPNGFLVNSAVQVLDRSVISYIKKEKAFDLPKDVYTKVLKDKKIYGYELEGERIAIDSPERYNDAGTAIERGVFR